MFEVKETSPTGDLKHGITSVSTVAAPVTPNSVSLVRGLMIRAPGPNDLGGGNSAFIYVGLKSVTADQTATGGFPLPPGSAIELPVEDPSLVFVVSTADGQSAAWLGI